MILASDTFTIRPTNYFDEVFIIGRWVEGRIEPYKNYLKNQGINAKSICDNPLWDCDNFSEAIHTVELNRQIIRDLKLKGVRFLNIGDGNAPNPSDYYDMELDEIFN